MPKYARRFVVKGIEYRQFRKAGHPRDGERLRSPWAQDAEWQGSAIELEVAAILATQPAKPRLTNLAGATRAYELGADFGSLSTSTKYEYRLLLKEFDAALGTLPIGTFTAGFIVSLRDAWAERGHRAANVRLQVLKNVLNPQLVALDLPDPFSRVAQVRRPREAREPHPIWPEAVVRTVIEAAAGARKFGLARAVAIARYAGARRGDLVRVGHACRKEGRISWLSGKRQILVDMPEDPLLSSWLAATPAAQPATRWQLHIERKTGVVRMPPKTLAFNTSNLPYTADGLGQELAKLVGGLHASGKLDSDRYDLHGLRHTFGVEAALAGLTDAQGAALMGHASPNSFATYRRQANRLRLSDDGAALIQAMREKAAGTAADHDLSNGRLSASNPGRPARPPTSRSR